MNEQMPQQPRFPEVADELQRMAKEDQDMREKGMREDTWDTTVDKRNTARLKQIVDNIGWPTISKVGRQGSTDAWLLVQHADHDVEFQKECLSSMKTEPADEVDAQDIAYLEDRILVHDGKPQLYGTQFHDSDKTGEYIPRPIAEPELVDERRSSMGLDMLAENTAWINQKFKKN